MIIKNGFTRATAILLSGTMLFTTLTGCGSSGLKSYISSGLKSYISSELESYMNTDDGKTGSSETKSYTSTDDGKTIISYDAVSAQCPECQKAAELSSGLIALANFANGDYPNVYSTEGLDKFANEIQVFADTLENYDPTWGELAKACAAMRDAYAKNKDTSDTDYKNARDKVYEVMNVSFPEELIDYFSNSWSSDFSDYLYNYIKIKLRETENMVYDLMNHNCTAETVYVENYPYVCNDCIGYYTGSWKGCGPVDEGTFTGFKMKWFADNPACYDNTYTYKGEWQGGLPNGQGDYSLLIYPNEEALQSDYGDIHFEEYYSGEMGKGMKNGRGVVTTIFHRFDMDDGDRISYFSECTFKDDKLSGSVEFADYDNKGLAKAGSAMQGPGRGGLDGYYSLIPENISYDREHSQEKRNDILQMAAAIAVVGAGLYLGIKLADDSGGNSYNSSQNNQQAMMNYLDQSGEEDQKKAMEEAALIAQQQESDRQYYEKKYEESLAYDMSNGGKISLDTQRYKAWAGY